MPLILLLLAAAVAADEPDQANPDSFSYLDNGAIRLGVNLGLGGAITHLSKSGSDENLINSHDWGRQIQMSHYSGPVPFAPAGKQPRPDWAGLGWNPIQSGDCYGHRSRLLDHRNDGRELYLKCVPMQWPLENEPGECVFECWITLDGPTARVRSRMLNNRSDKTFYPGRGQELPAVYTNGPWYRLLTYTGDQPFTGGPVETIPPQFPWAAWQATENWAALLNEADFGVGIYEPGVFQFIGGFAGQPGAGGPKDAPTGYIAPLHNEVMDWNIDYEYRYVLIVGTLPEIRQTIYALAPQPAPPSWRFATDRRHWMYANCQDTGWPIQGELNILLEGNDPQLLSPPGQWSAAAAPTLYVEAALQSAQSEAQLFWSRRDAPGFTEARSLRFPLKPDAQYHLYELPLSPSPEYQGSITALRLDPVPSGQPGDHIRIRSIGFTKPQADE